MTNPKKDSPEGSGPADKGRPLGAVSDEVLMQAWLEAVEQLALRRAQLREAQGAETRYEGEADPIEQDLGDEARRERAMFNELQARRLL